MPTQKEMAWLAKNRPEVYAKLSSKVDPSTLPKDKKDPSYQGGKAPAAIDSQSNYQDPPASGGGGTTKPPVSPYGNPKEMALRTMISNGLKRPMDGMANRKRKT